MTDPNLSDAVNATTPQAVVLHALAKIEAAESAWETIRRTLAAQDSANTKEAARYIDARRVRRAQMMDLLSDPYGLAAALSLAAQMGRAEAEARWLIKEVRW